MSARNTRRKRMLHGDTQSTLMQQHPMSEEGSSTFEVPPEDKAVMTNAMMAIAITWMQEEAREAFVAWDDFLWEAPTPHYLHPTVKEGVLDAMFDSLGVILVLFQSLDPADVMKAYRAYTLAQTDRGRSISVLHHQLINTIVEQLWSNQSERSYFDAFKIMMTKGAKILKDEDFMDEEITGLRNHIRSLLATFGEDE
jgi:hypothetical protein